MKLPAPHGRLHFFLKSLHGSLKEQVVADSRELNRLRKIAGEEATARFREVADQIKSLLVKREVVAAIINQPQVGILRMGEIVKRAVVRQVDGQDAIVTTA